jgi:sensor histidine kinase YesM
MGTNKKNSKVKTPDKRSVIIQHGLFWMVIYMVFVLIDQSQFSLQLSLIKEAVNVFFYAFVVYLNLWVLIPNYLSSKRLVLYSVFLILLAILITPIKTYVLFQVISQYPNVMSEMIESQYIIFLTTLLVLSASTIFKIVFDWLQHQREKKELQTQTMKSELRFLKSQINPHFLFNTLNNLYALTLKKSDLAPEIVLKLSEIMRYMLYEYNERRVPLTKEITYIKNYLALEELRQGKNVKIHFNIEGDPDDISIAPLMFTPFLENSFKHGLNRSITEGYVDILLRIQQDKLFFSVENSKPEALPKPDGRRSGGIGLANVKRRLNLIYPDQYKLHINDMPAAYRIEMEINLE